VQRGAAREICYPQQSPCPEVAYVLNSSPALSETFIAQEIVELERQKLPLRLFALSGETAWKEASVSWKGSVPILCLGTCSKFTLLLHAWGRFVKAPRSFLKALLLMVGHYSMRSAASSLLYASYLSDQLERQRIRHLHAHYATEPTTVAQAAHLLTGIPYSFTAHAYDIYLSPQAELRYKMQMARFVTTCTEYNRHYLSGIDAHLAGRIHCIYHGLNLQAFRPPPNPTTQLRGPARILAVCRLIEKKGLSYLVQACHTLKKRGYRFTVHIVGDGPLREPLEQEIRSLGLSEDISLLGSVAHEGVLELYRQVAIFALPCVIGKNGDRDGIPNVLIEALYMGVAVISTLISGIPELIEQEVDGLLVPPADSNALADALARLLDDVELRNRLAAAGHRKVLDKFDMALNASRLRDLLCTGEEQYA